MNPKMNKARLLLEALDDMKLTFTLSPSDIDPSPHLRTSLYKNASHGNSAVSGTVPKYIFCASPTGLEPALSELSPASPIFGPEKALDEDSCV